MTRRHDVTQVVFDAEIHSGEWVPENLREAIAWLQAKLDVLPADMRDGATIVIQSPIYDGDYTSIKIEGRRPETDEEQAARLKAEIAKKVGVALAREIQERAAYEALRRKYGDKS